MRVHWGDMVVNFLLLVSALVRKLKFDMKCIKEIEEKLDLITSLI